MKAICVAFCILLYIIISLPFSVLIGIYFVLRSVPKTWALLRTGLLGQRKRNEAKELEEKHTRLYKDILAKLAKQPEPSKPERPEVFTISGKWGNC